MINTEAHKRMQYPDPKDYQLEYHLDTRLGEERHCAIDGNGFIIHLFGSREQAQMQLPIMRIASRGILAALQSKVRLHKERFPEYYAPTYEEANFIQKAIMRGFVPYPEHFNPYDNWFGVSRYAPDAILTKGNKRIVLSLQGVAMPYLRGVTTDSNPIAKEMGLKYLAFINGGTKEYETYYGELPSQEFIEKFISEDE